MFLKIFQLTLCLLAALYKHVIGIHAETGSPLWNVVVIYRAVVVVERQVKLITRDMPYHSGATDL